MARRARLLIALLVLAAAAATPQKRYLVSPDREVIPLRPGDDVPGLIAAQSRPGAPPAAFDCDPPGFGYPQWVWWTDLMFNARHNDVIAQWFITPGAGTVDSIFWVNGEIGNLLDDSTALLRVHRSAIGPDYGPGIRPGPFDPPCQPWGYWQNTNDLDGGIAAFPEDATDTAWISTYPGSGMPTRPPVDEALWGGAGYPVKLKPNSVNFAAMADLGPLAVERGDRLFVTIRLPLDPAYTPFPHVEIEEVPTQFAATAQSLDDHPGEYPSRDWKFYEHPRGPSVCGSYDVDSLPAGWFARGGVGADSTDLMAFNIWYAMTITGDAPPNVWTGPMGHTFDTGDRPLAALIWDCYSAVPGNTEIDGAFIRYAVDGVDQPPVPMVSPGVDFWEGAIPGQPVGSLVSYRVSGVDRDGDTGTSPTYSYRVLEFGNDWYAIDTGYACSFADIAATGAAVDPGDLFLPPGAPGPASAWDEGTAGPFDLGGEFTLFGDPFRYAWVGVNGGIALTKSAADTQDVNAGGVWQGMPAYQWDFPNPQREGRGGPAAALAMPGMFIAPFWSDLVVKDSIAAYGRIVVGNGGDTCRFIVEWDSVGRREGSGVDDFPSRFSLILDRCTGAVEFQYSPFFEPSWKPVLTGMQADSTAASGPEPGYVLLSRNGGPPETAPADGRCIRMVPTVGFTAASGWDLVSIPLAALDGDHSVGHLFPGYENRIWTYRVPGGYAGPAADSLPPGRGFWIRAADAGRIGTVPGELIGCVSVPVHDKWNLVGGPSCAVPVGDVQAAGGTIVSPFFGYGQTGYYNATHLQPGEAYWVKMNGAGILDICCPGGPVLVPAAGSPERPDE